MPLVLVGTPIGNLGDLTPRAVEALRDADVIACEDTRRTRKLLTHAGIRGGHRLRAVHAHNEVEAASRIVAEVRDGKRVAYASDAGMPGISDPGARLVQACVAAGLPVEVVPGPSAVLSALVLSGLATERFVFEGFLPRKGKERRAQLAAIAIEPRTVVLYEAPRRVLGTLTDLVGVCDPSRPVALVRELTKVHEEIYRGPLSGAVQKVTEHEPRGEYVIVLAGAPVQATNASDGAIEAALRDAFGRGRSARDAAADVAEQLGVPKRRAYEVAISLRSR